MYKTTLNTILYNESTSPSLYCPICIPTTTATCAFSTPFVDLPQQEPPYSTLRPLPESFSPPPPSELGSNRLSQPAGRGTQPQAPNHICPGSVLHPERR